MLLPNNHVWAMEPLALESLAERLAILPQLAGTVEVVHNGDAGQGYEPEGAVARVYVSGALLKSTAEAQLYRAYGEEATSYGEIRGAIEAANADPRVSSVLLVIDSPGGQVSGIHATADAIAGSKKPVSAHIETLGASAAYWIASQAKVITANRGAMIGSIGAYCAVVDVSQRAAAAGVKVHVVSSGKHKGGGVPGAPVSAEQLAEIQGRIDAIASEFVADVAKGRGEIPARIMESADGRVYSAVEAISRRLINSISEPIPTKASMLDTFKNAAALIREFPAHATIISDSLAEGKSIDDIRLGLERSAAAEKVAAVEKDAADAKAALEAAKVEAVARESKITELEKALADAKAAHDALKAVGAGAKAADAVIADPPKQDESATQSEIDAMGGIERAKFFLRGGKVRSAE